MIKPDIAVYTVITGNYDTLEGPAEIEDGVDYICFVDSMDTPVPAPWQKRLIVSVKQGLRLDAKRLSRYPKILSHKMFPEGSYSFTLYHDANFELNVLARELLYQYLTDNEAVIAFYKHPHRSGPGSVRKEGDVCIQAGLDTATSVNAQLEKYRREGVLEELRLLCGGIILRRCCPTLRRFELVWWNEYMSGSVRDQLSLPYALHHSEIETVVIDKDYFYSNPYFTYRRHSGGRAGAR